MFEFEYNSRTLLIDYDYDKPEPENGYAGGIYINEIRYKNFSILRLPRKLESMIINRINEIELNRAYDEAAMKADWLHDINR